MFVLVAEGEENEEGEEGDSDLSSDELQADQAKQRQRPGASTSGG